MCDQKSKDFKQNDEYKVQNDSCMPQKGRCIKKMIVTQSKIEDKHSKLLKSTT